VDNLEAGLVEVLKETVMELLTEYPTEL